MAITIKALYEHPGALLKDVHGCRSGSAGPDAHLCSTYQNTNHILCIDGVSVCVNFLILLVYLQLLRRDL